MRIDKFLKVSRLIKRRETAKELCDDGDVFIGERAVKASAEVNVGDMLTLKLGAHTITAKVVEIRPFANKETAASMLEIISDQVKERN